jgi:hypothetical protein
VRLDVGADGAVFEEAVRGVVRWNEVEDAGEDLPLEMLEADFGRFDEADVAEGFGDDDGFVVAEGRLQ